MSRRCVVSLNLPRCDETTSRHAWYGQVNLNTSGIIPNLFYTLLVVHSVHVRARIDVAGIKRYTDEFVKPSESNVFVCSLFHSA